VLAADAGGESLVHAGAFPPFEQQAEQAVILLSVQQRSQLGNQLAALQGAGSVRKVVGHGLQPVAKLAKAGMRPKPLPDALRETDLLILLNSCRQCAAPPTTLVSAGSAKPALTSIKEAAAASD